jgi:hypothetical protein
VDRGFDSVRALLRPGEMVLTRRRQSAIADNERNPTPLCQGEAFQTRHDLHSMIAATKKPGRISETFKDSPAFDAQRVPIN